MRTLAIDAGSKRVGLALSDAEGKFATPYEVLEVASVGVAIAGILKIIVAEQVERVVVGVPLNMDDSRGAAAKGAIAFGREVGKKSGKSVIFVDERLSSFDAEQRLIERKRGGEKISRKQKKERLDALAAAGFLQAFLDGKLAALDVED